MPRNDMVVRSFEVESGGSAKDSATTRLAQPTEEIARPAKMRRYLLEQAFFMSKQVFFLVVSLCVSHAIRQAAYGTVPASRFVIGMV